MEEEQEHGHPPDGMGDNGDNAVITSFGNQIAHYGVQVALLTGELERAKATIRVLEAQLAEKKEKK